MRYQKFAFPKLLNPHSDTLDLYSFQLHLSFGSQEQPEIIFALALRILTGFSSPYLHSLFGTVHIILDVLLPTANIRNMLTTMSVVPVLRKY